MELQGEHIGQCWRYNTLNKFKLFVENFLIYGLGGIISQIIPVIMVPIVIRLMPNSDYYGISDLSNTVISFGSAFAIMGMYDAMYRMFFEKENEQYKKKICSTALCFVMVASIVVFSIMLLGKNFISRYFFGNKGYAYVVYISATATLVGATNTIVAAPTRMQNKRKIFLITNTLSPLLAYAISIPMLLAGYYVIALPLAAMISGIVLEIVFGILNRKWFVVRKFDFGILKQLLVIAVPLLPNFLIYWVFNCCDKVMITNMLGIGAAGIYSVGAKLGYASQLIYTAFAGGWQYFAFATMREKDQVKTNSRIFEYLGVISFIATMFISAWSFIIYDIVFTDEYLSGYIIAPYLFLAPLLQMLFQVAANQFIVIKKTWPNMFILSVGAITNVLMNLLLIPMIGIEGAAIATLLGYVVADIICCIVLIRMNLMFIRFKFMIAVLIMACYFTVWRVFFSTKTIIATGLAIVFSLLLMLLYVEDFKCLIKKRK